MPGNANRCQTLSKPPRILPADAPSARRRLSGWIGRAARLRFRVRVAAWLLMSLAAERLGLPMLFSVALAALPWLLLASVTEMKVKETPTNRR